jgi:hypothetical protein
VAVADELAAGLYEAVMTEVAQLWARQIEPALDAVPESERGATGFAAVLA